MSTAYLDLDGEAVVVPAYIKAGRTDDHGRAWTREQEERTGSDSIETIERVYERTPRGKFCCPWPRCGFTTWDATGMWLHVHGKRHHDQWVRSRRERA